MLFLRMLRCTKTSWVLGESQPSKKREGGRKKKVHDAFITHASATTSRESHLVESNIKAANQSAAASCQRQCCASFVTPCPCPPSTLNFQKYRRGCSVYTRMSMTLDHPSLLLLFLATTALQACCAAARDIPPVEGAHVSSEGDLVRADIDPASFSATRLHEDKSFS